MAIKINMVLVSSMKFNIFKEKKAGIFSIEILITILILIVIINIIFNMISISTDKITDSIDFNKQEILTSEVLDNLIKTEGNPSNWDEINYQNSYTPGLNLDEENHLQVLSFSKIIALSQNYDNLINNNILNGQLKSQIIICPLNNNLENIILGDTPSLDISNIAVDNRTVKIDYLSNYTILNLSCNNTYNHVCHENHENNWICNSFNVYYDLNQYDYYILSNNNIDYKLSNGIYSTNLKSSNSCTKINNYIKFLSGNNSSIVILHILKNKDFNLKVVAVPKNTDVKYLKYDYFKSQDAYIIFKTWY